MELKKVTEQEQEHEVFSVIKCVSILQKDLLKQWVILPL